MTCHIRLPILFLLAALIGACGTPQPSESDLKIAQLQKELDAAKQEAAAKEQGATGEAGSTAAALAPNAAAPSTPAASTPGRAATEPASSEQKAAAARQAEENAELRRQVDEMKPREFTLPSGTTIPVRTTAELSTKSVSNGSVFEGLLEKNLVVDDTVLAKAGSRVTCVVVASDKGGKVKGVASLSVAAKSIAGVNGHTIAVRTSSYDVTAKSTTGKDVKRTGIATGAGAVIGAIAGGGKGAAIGAGVGAGAGVGTAMATRGDAAVIPTETLIEFTLSAPSTVVFRK
jgi:hypothetical protein